MSVRELVCRLEECDAMIHERPAQALMLAKTLEREVRGLVASAYYRRNLRMRSAGVLGAALLASGQIEEARRVLETGGGCEGTTTERASLGLRLTHLYTVISEWRKALAEVDEAQKHFEGHTPRPESDTRSMASALTTRGNVFKVAWEQHVDPRELDLDEGTDFLSLAADDYRSALRRASSRTPRTILSSAVNLTAVSWFRWCTGSVRIGQPAESDRQIRRLYRLLKRSGHRDGDYSYAMVRWLHGLSIAQSFGRLNDPAEQRLLKAQEELLGSGAIREAAELAIDLCYWYLIERRWDDMAVVIASVLYHPSARSLTKERYQALVMWQHGIEGRKSEAIALVFEEVRGFSGVRIEMEPEIDLPRSRWGDRANTGGL